MTDWTLERMAAGRSVRAWTRNLSLASTASDHEPCPSGSHRASAAAIREIQWLREELRIAKNSWNWEEGQRCFAERDAALAECRELTMALKVAAEENNCLRRNLA